MNSEHKQRFAAATRALTETLISRPSVTPKDADCQSLLAERLQTLGFTLTWIKSGPDDALVTNLWAKKTGKSASPATLVFAGHTDVVPPGPLPQWTSDPFVPTEREGKLYGRGAADMKTSLAAMVVATEHFVHQHPDHQGSIAFLLTSDEEGPAVDGTVKVCDFLRQSGERLDYCIVGEPTSVTTLGDMVKHGRRGSLSGELTIHGQQGHVAYPHLAQNPIHQFAPALAELVSTTWDNGNDHFPATTWQISNMQAGSGATNVIPGELKLWFNFRFSTESTPASLQQRLEDILKKHRCGFTVRWTLGGEPFLTPPGTLSEALTHAIKDVMGIEPELSTTGGTSDGRFIAKICPQVIEFGPPNASIHKIDEHIDIAWIGPLAEVYHHALLSLVR